MSKNKKILLLFFVFTNIYCFSQEKKITYDEVKNAFDLIFKEPKQAKIKLDLLEKKTINQKDSLYALVLNNKGVYFGVQTNIDSSLYYFNKAAKHIDKGSVRFISINNNIGILLNKAGKTDEALELFYKNLEASKKIKSNKTTALIYGEIAACYSTREEYTKALENIIESIKLWELVKPVNKQKIAIEKQKMGNLYSITGNYKFALKLYDEAKLIFKKNDDIYNFQKVCISQANTYLLQKKPLEVIKLLEKANPIIEEYSDKELLTFSYFLEAKANELLKQNKKAKEKYTNAVSYGLKNNQKRVAHTVIEFGNFLLNTKDFVALNNLIINEENKDFTALLELAPTEDKMGFYKLLYDYAVITQNPKLNFYSDKVEKYSLILEQKYNLFQVKELQARHEIQITAKEKEITEQIHEIEKKRLYIILLSITIALVVIAFLYHRNKNKSKLLQLTLEKKNIENELKDIQIKNQKGKIKEQETDILAQTIKTIETDKEIEILTSNIEENEPEKLKILQSQKVNKQYWNKLIEKFKTLKPLFISLLIAKHPSLTKGERDFCCLLKMNLSNKEIANILQIRPESVVTKKYRLAKKLNLEKDIDINQWLNTLE